MTQIPVIDLFAGPGGLGEGFTSFKGRDGESQFRLAISLEMEPWAHSTLRFRSFLRALERPLTPDEWILAAGSSGGPDRLMDRFPRIRRKAEDEAVRRTLGKDDPVEIRNLIRSAIGKTPDTVVIGGPPCQAYSLAGRSRNRGIADYVPEQDHRQTLYLEYLQILADHEPAAFIMENVKGLMSASLHSRRLFDLILSDLQAPAAAIARAGRKAWGGGSKYRIYSLAPSDGLFKRSDSYVIRAERFGVPQARHRIILVGIRSDISAEPDTLAPTPGPNVRQVITDLPELRSSLSSGNGRAAAEWREALHGIEERGWLQHVKPDVRSHMLDRLRQVKAFRIGNGANLIERRESLAPALDWVGPIPPFILNHQARSHMATDLERYFFAASWAEVRGKSPTLGDFPRPLLPKHRNVARALNGELFADRFRVQLADRPATTVTSHIAKDGHYFIHYDPRQCRSLTVREAARLQTFPEDYLFTGPRTSQYQQVGNAVPPHLARQIAASVAGAIGRQPRG